MKRRLTTVLTGLMMAAMLSGCGVTSITDAIGDRIGTGAGAEEYTDADKESDESLHEKKDDSAEGIAVLDDLLGDKLGKPSEAGSIDSYDSDGDDDSYDPDAPENQTVVTRAEEWQGFYYGTVSVIGFGDSYSGIEEEYEAYAFVIYPDDDNPFLEIYSDDFDIWNNYSFGYEDGALASMYVEPTDTALTPVVYEDGDAYVVDSVMSVEDAQAFKATSDGKSVARLVGQYNYVDPEALEDGVETGLLMLFNLVKEPIE